MKTKLKVGGLVSVLFLLSFIFLNSCTKEESLNAPEESSSQNLQLKNGSIPSHTEDVFCDLIAGQTIPVGQVLISHDEVNIYVQYLTSGNWGLSEVHLYIGTSDGVPRNNKAIQIGLFPYSASNLNGVSQFSFEVPISELPDEPAEGYAIFAHAVVTNGDQQETAWSNNCAYKPLITVKSWFKDSWWAASTGVSFSDDPNKWCYLLGTNVYGGPDTYYFQSDNVSMVNPGHIEVSDNGSQLLVDVFANVAEGWKLARTYVYVGNMTGLQTYVGDDGCPQYTNFPNKNLIEGNVHSFMFPLSTINSISFKEEFGSNRWGWFFHYPLN